jgi:hypothetical protein
MAEGKPFGSTTARLGASFGVYRTLRPRVNQRGLTPGLTLSRAIGLAAVTEFKELSGTKDRIDGLIEITATGSCENPDVAHNLDLFECKLQKGCPITLGKEVGILIIAEKNANELRDRGV